MQYQYSMAAVTYRASKRKKLLRVRALCTAMDNGLVLHFILSSQHLPSTNLAVATSHVLYHSCLKGANAMRTLPAMLGNWNPSSPEHLLSLLKSLLKVHLSSGALVLYFVTILLALVCATITDHVSQHCYCFSASVFDVVALQGKGMPLP